MIATSDFKSEIESYLSFLIDHGLEETYETEPLNRTLSENKTNFQRAAAAPAQIPVTPIQGTHSPQAFRPPILANIDLGTLLHEAKQRAHAARTLDELYAELEAFQHMPMRHEGAKSLIRHRGTSTPELLVIGEIPSSEDDQTGVAFSGKPGDLIDKALIAANIFDTSMLTACVFWRPAGGRPLTQEDINLNAPFVEAMIRLTAPKAILLLGSTAVACVLNLDQNLAKLRGRIVTHKADQGAAVPVMASYPPNFLLRQPQAKAMLWRDLLHIADHVGLK